MKTMVNKPKIQKQNAKNKIVAKENLNNLTNLFLGLFKLSIRYSLFFFLSIHFFLTNLIKYLDVIDDYFVFCFLFLRFMLVPLQFFSTIYNFLYNKNIFILSKNLNKK